MKCTACGRFTGAGDDLSAHTRTCARYPVHGPEAPPPATCGVLTRRGHRCRTVLTFGPCDVHGVAS